MLLRIRDEDYCIHLNGAGRETSFPTPGAQFYSAYTHTRTYAFHAKSGLQKRRESIRIRFALRQG